MTSKPANLFIGLEITKKREERKIFIPQQNYYIRSLLHKFKMTDCNPKSVPADPGSRLSVIDCPLRCGVTPLSSTPYRLAVGGLMYAAKKTRPDILFAVTAASRYNQDPGNAHWSAVKRILSYRHNQSRTFLQRDGFGGPSRRLLRLRLCWLPGHQEVNLQANFHF